MQAKHYVWAGCIAFSAGFWAFVYCFPRLGIGIVVLFLLGILFSGAHPNDGENYYER